MPTYDKEYIIRYLEGDLNAWELQQFEADCKNNPALAAEVALYKEALATFRQRLSNDETKAALRTTLHQLNGSHFKAPAKIIALKKYVSAIAAAAAIIIFVVIMWPNGSYMDEFGSTTMINTTERGDNADSLLQQASVYFNKKDFSKALPLLERAVQADSSNQMALFYTGVAQVHTGSTTPARKNLAQVYAGESVFQYEAAFYLALSYAQEKNNNAAITWLRKIPAGTPVSQKAEQLLKKLK
jgi:tetratricopeptide (TPR) repeat protein